MKPTETKTPNLVGPNYSLSIDDDTVSPHNHPPIPDEVKREK